LKWQSTGKAALPLKPTENGKPTTTTGSGNRNLAPMLHCAQYQKNSLIVSPFSENPKQVNDLRYFTGNQ
jgi:hypothetical protein